LVNILVAEDNLGDLLLIQRALEEHEVVHEMHVVRDGSGALAFVERMGRPEEAIPCPDVFLLDLNLPKIDAPEILNELRKHAACAQIPVIAVTSSDTPKDRAQMAEFNVARYFRKPSHLEAFLQLGAVVREVLAAGPAPSKTP
jgi:CheY-like chemotaxis protein